VVCVVVVAVTPDVVVCVVVVAVCVGVVAVDVVFVVVDGGTKNESVYCRGSVGGGNADCAGVPVPDYGDDLSYRRHVVAGPPVRAPKLTELTPLKLAAGNRNIIGPPWRIPAKNRLFSVPG